MASPLETFVSDLTSTGLISAEDLQALLGPDAQRQAFESAEALARELVRRDWLTEFQAAALVNGESATLKIENYILQDQLGSGGMGKVFKAEHRRLKRVVALKVLDRGALLTPRDVQRFHREVEAVAKLSHPNIVAALDAGEDTGTHFLVMEYVPGRDLSQTVKIDGPLSVARSLDYIAQAARGLREAHAAGIIHRDIKPANLLLDGSGTVKLLDLGLARFEERGEGDGGTNTGLTQTGMIMGTADYMSPEQALDSHTADLRSDIYSLGCTLHYLLLGRVMYVGNTVMKKLLSHRDHPIPSLRAVRPDVPAMVDAVFARMVAKSPEARFQSMAEVVQALEACLRQLPASASGAPCLAAEGDEMASINLAPIDTFNIQDEPRSSTITSASHVLSRRRNQKGARLPLVVTCVALLLVVIGMLSTLRNKKPAATEGEPLAASPTRTTKSSPAPAKSSGIAAAGRKNLVKLPPLGWGKPPDVVPGLALNPPLLPGLGRWQVTGVRPAATMQTIDWSPDGTRVVVGGSDGELRLYQVYGWKLLSVLAGPSDFIYAVAWNPEGSRIASLGNSGVVRLWHADGTPGPVLEGNHRDSGLKWSPNGQWLAIHTENQLGLWTADGRRSKVFPFDPAKPRDLAWNPDGTQLVSIRGRELRILNLDGSAPRNPIKFTHPQDLRSVAWGARGQIAVLDFKDNLYLHLLHRADPLLIEKAGIRAADFSPDGNELALLKNNSVEIYTADGKPTQARQRVNDGHGVCWSRDGKRVAWAGRNVGVWEPWGAAAEIPCGSGLVGFDVQPQGGETATVHADEGLRWWTAEGNMRRFEAVSEGLNHARWAPDGRTLAAAYKKFLAFSVEDGPLKPRFDSSGSNFAWRADGQRIARGSNKTVRIFDLQGIVDGELTGHTQNVELLHWSKTGLLASSDGCDLRLWTTSGGAGPRVESLGNWKPGDRSITGLAWNADGSLLAVGTQQRDGVMLVRADGTVAKRLPMQYHADHLAWSPDGQLAVSHSGGVQLWNADGTAGPALKGVVGQPRGIRWSGGNRIVAWSRDGSLRCWDGVSRQLLWVAVASPGTGTATIDALGNITHSSATTADEVLSYLIEREHGRLQAMPPSEFKRLIK